jgi:hypothetical protein
MVVSKLEGTKNYFFRFEREGEQRWQRKKRQKKLRRKKLLKKQLAKKSSVVFRFVSVFAEQRTEGRP